MEKSKVEDIDSLRKDSLRGGVVAFEITNLGGRGGTASGSTYFALGGLIQLNCNVDACNTEGKG